MHPIYLQKIQPLLQDTQNTIQATNTSELVDFFKVLQQRLEQTQTSTINALPILFFGTPTPTELTTVEQYLGQALQRAITNLNGHPIHIKTMNNLPCTLYHWQNIVHSKWQQRPTTPGIILVFENGLNQPESIDQLQLFLKKMPLVKLIHANIPKEIGQALVQKTGHLINARLATLKANTLEADISLLASPTAISTMNAFVAISTFQSTTSTLLAEKVKTIQINTHVRKQVAQQALTQLTKKERQYTTNKATTFKQQINKRLKQFEALLEEQLRYQFHPTDGQLTNTFNQSLAQLDDLQGKKERKNMVYSLAPAFSTNITTQFKGFCETTCQKNLQLTTTYLEIIQRELQGFLSSHSLNTHLAMPTFLVEDKMDSLIRDTAKTTSPFSVNTPKKKFRDYLMAVREPFFIFFMMLSIAGTRNSMSDIPAAYMYPPIVFVVGLTIFNLWSKGMEEKETTIVKGITAAQAHLKNDLKKSTKEFSTNWKALLLNRIKDITQQWQQQIDTLLQQQEQQEKEQLQREKNRLQLILTQLGQQEGALTAFERNRKGREMGINRTFAEVKGALKQVVGGGSRLSR